MRGRVVPDRPISIVYFSNALVRGGAEEHIVTLLQGLDGRRFRLRLVCTPEVASKVASDVPAHVEVTPLSLRRPADLRAAAQFVGLLRRWKPDVLHSHLFYASVFASPLGRLCRVPVIVETPHVREEWRRGWLKSRFVVDRLVGRCVDAYVAVSHANAAYLIERKGIPARKVVVIQNGCDLERFWVSADVGKATRQRLGISRRAAVVAVIGRLEPQKGHRVLFDALPRVRAEIADLRVVVVGEGTLRPALERQVTRLGLETCVEFVGYQADIGPWLGAADVTVLPSFYEGLPLVAIESLAAGRPMVASAVDGVPEVVVDGETGLTVPPGEPGLLADALIRMLADQGLRERLGETGRRLVRERFTKERQLRSTAQLYCQTVGGMPLQSSPAGERAEPGSPAASAGNRSA